MLVHRFLDAFFRALDSVDAVRDRVDRSLGRDPRPDPWAVEWPPPDGGPFEGEDAVRQTFKEDVPSHVADAAEAEAEAEAREAAEEAKAAKADADETQKKAARAEENVEGAKAKTKSASTSPAKSGASKASSKKKPGRKKKSSSKRKGSVDRSGKDLSSPRADAVVASLESSGRAGVTEESELQGKKVLARVVWALSEAQAAGVDGGLTTNDVSALLSKAVGIEVFATNIGRACRDHKDLIAEGEPDGRSKRYLLTKAGKAAASEIEEAGE